MPTPEPPVVENETVQLLSPPRRIKLEPLPAGDLLRPIQAGYQNTGMVDHRLQLVAFNDLDGIKADNLILFARLQESDSPRPVVNLWYDSALLASQALYDFADYRRVVLGVPETVREPFLRFTLREIRFAMETNGYAWPEGITDYLATSRYFSPEDFRWLEGRVLPDLLQARDNQRGLLNYIKDNLTGFTVNEYDIRSTELPADVRPTAHWYARFNQYAFLKDNLPFAQDLLFMHLMDQGGLIIEGNSPEPELQGSVFPSGILDNLQGREKLLGKLAERQVAREKLSEVYGNKWQAASRRQLQVIKKREGVLYKGDYIGEIEKLNPALAGQLRQTTPNRPVSIRDFFKPLEAWSVVSSQGVRQVNPEGLGRPPRVYLAEQHAPAVRTMAEDASRVLAFIDDYALQWEEIHNNPALDTFVKESRAQGTLNAHFFGGKYIDSAGDPNSFGKIKSKIGKFIKQQFEDRKPGFKNRYPGFHDRLSTLVRLNANSLVNQDIDLKGDIAGPNALSRQLPEASRSEQIGGKQQTLRVFDNIRFGLPLSATPSQAEALDARATQWVKTRNYDSLIILQIGDEKTLSSAARNIFLEHEASTNVYWGRLETIEETRARMQNPGRSNRGIPRKLIDIENRPFQPDQRTQLQLVVHGEPTQPAFAGDLNGVQLADLIVQQFFSGLPHEQRFLGDIVCTSCQLLKPSVDLFEWVDPEKPGEQGHFSLLARDNPEIGSSKPGLLLRALGAKGVRLSGGIEVYSKKVRLVGTTPHFVEEDIVTHELFITTQPALAAELARFDGRPGEKEVLANEKGQA